jgi:hypothetical protein
MTAIAAAVVGGGLVMAVVTLLLLVRLAARVGATSVMSTGDDEP